MQSLDVKGGKASTVVPFTSYSNAMYQFGWLPQSLISEQMDWHGWGWEESWRTSQALVWTLSWRLQSLLERGTRSEAESLQRQENL